MDLVEIQTGVLAGVVAGFVLWPRALIWPLSIVAALPESGRSIRKIASVALLHSGPWVLALIVWFTYYVLTRFSIASIQWLMGAFYGSLLLQLLLTTHLYRITRSTESHRNQSPLLWFARAMRRKRNFFIFGYVVAAFVGLPHLLRLHGSAGFMFFALVVSVAGVHFMFWYMWQFVGPELEAADDSVSKSKGGSDGAAYPPRSTNAPASGFYSAADMVARRLA